jgi:feruloyl esterase
MSAAHALYRPRSRRSRALAPLASLAAALLAPFAPARAHADGPCGAYAAGPGAPPAAASAGLARELLAMPDATTVLAGIEPVAASGTLPAYCRVRGTTTPQVNFELRLPANWNGKFLMQGCGGMCGWLNMGAAEDSLERGYAVVNTDMGHQGAPSTAAWAYDNRSAELDFAYRATWTTAVVARHIATRFYGTAPRHAYFNGCSTGGRQGLLVAQRFPELFDGVIAGAPVMNQTGVGMLHLLWSARANVDGEGRPILSKATLERVRERVLAACDRQDGVTDGIIPDPRACNWKPEAMACDASVARAAGAPQGGGAGCLNAIELGALRRLYDGASNSTGSLARAGGGGLTLGSEYAWVPVFVNEAGRHGLLYENPGMIGEILQFKTFYDDPGPAASIRDFDFERDPPRLALTEAFYNVQNPDLRRFQARGGRLILYHGWDDTEVTPGNTVDYYETATRTMGGPGPTREFFRLFMVPGMGHCRRGIGADAIDYLGYLERWVEGGEAPEAMLAHKLVKEQSYLGLPRPRFPLPPAEYTWRRPVFAYPDIAVHGSKGDWRDPSTWRARRPPAAR